MPRHRTQSIEDASLACLQKADALSVPVDAVKVAKSLKVSVHQETLEEEVSGVLLIKGPERHILVNRAHHPNRQRFSIAHELGHLVLHHKEKDGDRLFVDTHIKLYQRVGAPSDKAYSEPGSATTPNEERQANEFASSLLMPASLLEQAARERDLRDELDVSALATMFAVSEQAMAIRLQQLQVVNSVLMTEPKRTPAGTLQKTH